MRERSNMLNWNLLKNPVNYFIILLMLLIAAYGGHLLLTYYGATPSVQQKRQMNRNDVSQFNLG